ncbi:TIGR01620 family protein [Loktanella sp. D2R18]|uniref:YcjF family protein n=1 Tax=Rhodobacterales TaxID=204455 RepID=UPI000DE96FF7|nr:MULTISPECIES: TIGR01620 family protein [Rhodobacterales]MDO6591286.1 TIGR01620 family protein [Yoonia sp. 1_MG-2023]RBW46240.1 TIGR01620 family protein [Loktanella sp. D2R18]
MTNGPILIDLDETEKAQPDAAPPVPDLAINAQGAAMQQVATIAARKPSRLARLFWSITVTLAGFMLSLAAWDYVTGLLARSPILGGIATALVGAMALVLGLVTLRELAAFTRLKRLDAIQRQANDALNTGDLKAARAVVTALDKLYMMREDTAWGRAELQARSGDVLDADGLIGLAENTLLDPLDARAQREVEAAARQVATVTAIVPLALADLFTALTANMRMIRRIAEIYGGRAGTLGSWRLTRSVLTHLVATGAVAVGDDLIGSIAGGGVLSKVSRRFGEGVINGALTARVGVAAMEVCRPLPFHARPRPSVTALVRRALSGLFGKA